jgi:hypothetical protein
MNQHLNTMINRGGSAAGNAIVESIAAIVDGDNGKFSAGIRDLEQSAQIQSGGADFVQALANKASGSLLDACEAEIGISGDDVMDFVKAGKLSSRELSSMIFGWAQGDRTVLSHIDNNYGGKIRAFKARAGRGQQ